MGLFELLPIDDTIRPLILSRSAASTIREAASARGVKTMFEDALSKVFLGETTLEEALRATA
jgi:type II secretory ATPase GspE/PulE/Tfp pilus assembly ATPase PilB-like protein